MLLSTTSASAMVAGTIEAITVPSPSEDDALNSSNSSVRQSLGDSVNSPTTENFNMEARVAVCAGRRSGLELPLGEHLSHDWCGPPRASRRMGRQAGEWSRTAGDDG